MPMLLEDKSGHLGGIVDGILVGVRPVLWIQY